MRIFRKIFSAGSAWNSQRCLHLSRVKQGYEGPGKTTVTLMSRDIEYGLMVVNCNPHGFRLNNELKVLGPMVIFPKTVMGWNIASSFDVNEETLKLFEILEPKMELLVLGMEAEHSNHSKVVQNLRKLMKGLGVAHEILPVNKAIPIFNYMNSDGRYVVGAFIPPKCREYTGLVPMNERRDKS